MLFYQINLTTVGLETTFLPTAATTIGSVGQYLLVNLHFWRLHAKRAYRCG
jgi:hypothetical protein